MRNTIIKIVVTALVAIVLTVVVVFVWIGQRADHYRDLFSRIRPGMSKAEIRAQVGEPISIDSSGTTYEVWTFDVPGLFAERPRCYFVRGDDILVRFIWEPIDIILADDSVSENNEVEQEEWPAQGP